VYHLVFVNLSILEFGFALLLEGDNDQSHEDIDEEKGKHDEVNDVEDGHFDSIMEDGTVVLLRRGHRILQNPEQTRIVSRRVTSESNRRPVPWKTAHLLKRLGKMDAIR